MKIRWLTLAGLLAGGTVWGADLALSSGPSRVALVELFTSEGCSSCPPAERWLAGRRDDPGLWRDFVPVAWHVTYWDNLGWPDRLAQRVFTDRQYAYAAAWHRDSVYTPCFVRDGREWQPGLASAASAPAGILRVRYDPANGAASVEFEPVSLGPAEFEVNAALLGGGLKVAVRAGENSGRTLEHEFAALATARAPLVRAATVYRATLSLAPPAGQPPRLALAVWVTRRGELAPLQAAGGWIGPG
ncbi:MAG TPA: DUF1223 domain-containing protein [Opitutaceae bacterium]|nr:DUF1223 domain-containing protein [Opitutaceae bacterium]